jgi:hypothetical protein
MKCQHCQAEFEPKRTAAWQKYCSKACSKGATSKRWKDLNPEKALGTSPGSIGAAHEMLVCVDLLRRGYHVYRSVSPSAIFDLVVFRGDEMLSVEVTTGRYSPQGGIAHSPKDSSKFDVLAVVMRDGKIIYQPDISAEEQNLAEGRDSR